MSNPREPKPPLIVKDDAGSNVPSLAEELPVVARLIVEIRSDGTRTLARGAMEDAASGTRAAIEAAGATPMELAMALAKSMLAAPWIKRRVAGDAIRALLGKRR